MLKRWRNLKKRFYQNEWNLRCHPIVFMEISATVQTFPLVAQSSRWKMCWCISKPTYSENTFEEIFYCVKYLRAIRLITYLSLYGYDCTDSTLTNMNEWIHEEREWCVISLIKRVKYCYFFSFQKALCISGTFLWYQRFVQWDET